MAIALSQSEAESKEQEKKSGTNQLLSQHKYREPGKEKKTTEEEITPELMRYLNRDYWEEREQEKSDAQKQPLTATDSILKTRSSLSNTASPKVTKEVEMPAQTVYPGMMAAGVLPQSNYPTTKTDEELDEFVTTLKTQVEIFVNRMKSNSSRGRSIANDSSVQTLFMNTMAMHSQLLKHIEAQEEKRIHYEGLQDKLTQVKDARAALEALREEERERKRREAEEAERIRQIQMQEKLEVMRRKKQEYLQYQRQLALQRMQEQEREMMLRQEQVKQQYSMHMQMPPGVQQPGMPPQQMYGAYPQPQMHPGTAYPGYPAPGGDPNMVGQQQPPPPSGVVPPTQQQQPDIQQQQPHHPSMGVSTPYNMQGMVSALPTTGIMSNHPYAPPATPAAQGAPPPHPQQSMQPPMGGQASAPQPQQMTMQPQQQPLPPQGAPMPQDGSGMPLPGAPPASQLISFE